MKMKAGKIQRVDKSICTAEQKIAYNYAFSWHSILRKLYCNSELTAIQKSELLQDIVNSILASMKENEIDKKYNVDLIIHCFRNGVEKYANGFEVLSSYEQIGKAFPSNYEIV